MDAIPGRIGIFKARIEKPSKKRKEKVMKKLILAAGIAAVGAAVYADAISSSVVGYCTTTTNAPSFSTGAMFVGVSNSAKWELGQLSPTGFDEGTDFIQFLDSNNAKVTLQATWYDPATYGDDGGWCNRDNEDELLNTLQITPGTAFLSNMGDHAIGYTFAGAVGEAGADGKVTIDVSGQGSPFVANPLPKQITLGDIIPVGFEEGTDFIQFLNPNNAKVYLQATWYDPAVYGDEGGWCNRDNEDELLNDLPIAPGEAFLGNINTANSPALKFKFPSAL